MASRTLTELQRDAEQAWMQLRTGLHPAILNAPRMHWQEIDPRFLRYLYNEVRETPWFNQLTFMVGILTCHARLDRHTIEGRLYGLHARWRVLFPAYHITSFEGWKPSEHLPQYLNDSELADTFPMRQRFLQHYCAVTHHMAAYLRSLPETEHHVYRHWGFPALPSDLARNLSQSGIWLAEQQQRRKQETDALMPHFARIRGEGHLRWNQLKRLREKVQEAVQLIQSGQEILPLTFSYEEPKLERRLQFRLWDRYSFAKEHFHQSSKSRRRDYQNRINGFAPQKNHFFLEFVYAEQVTDGTRDPDALLWFGELLRYDLLGSKPMTGTEEEVRRKQDYLRAWGYGDEDEQAEKHPFKTCIAGVLAGSPSQARFLSAAQQRCKGLLLLVEPLFAAVTFGCPRLLHDDWGQDQ